MNAQEARAMSIANLKWPIIAPLLEHVFKKIKQEASKGRTSLTDPLSDLRCPVSFNEKEAVYNELRKQGYRVVDYPDPDPGHPCSSPYTNIEW